VRAHTHAPTPLLRVSLGVVRCWQAHRTEAGDRLAQKLSFLAAGTKGSARPSPALQPTFARALASACAALQALPGHARVRNRFMVVAHRMVVVLDLDGLLTLLAPALPLLVAAPDQAPADAPGGGGGGSDPWDVACELDREQVAALINQLAIAARLRFAPLLEPLLLPLLQRFADAIAAAVGGGASGVADGGAGGGAAAGIPSVACAVAAAVGSAQRLYLSLVSHVVLNGLAPCLASPRNAPHLPTVLAAVVAGVEDTADPVVKKLCLGILLGLLAEWGPAPAPPAAPPAVTPALPPPTVTPAPAPVPAALTHALLSFLAETAVPAALRCLVAPTFRPRDAYSARVVGDVAKLLWEVHRAAGLLQGPAFALGFAARIAATHGFPPTAAAQLSECLGAGTVAQLESALRGSLRR